MKSKRDAIAFWSSGKDSALTLFRILTRGEFSPKALITTVEETEGRVGMHEVRGALVERQALETGMPLIQVRIPFPCPNPVYEERVAAAIRPFLDAGITHAIFGDLFLQDIRDYRDQLFAKMGVTPVYPIWGKPSALLAHEIIAVGIEAVVVCVNPERLPASFLGRAFDDSFLRELPPDVDPAGENGEFHTAVVNAPYFNARIPYRLGDRFSKNGFEYVDLLLA